jgi:hypothetical protein
VPTSSSFPNFAVHGQFLILINFLRPDPFLLARYLTRPTWSHTASVRRPIADATSHGEPHVLIEAIADEGVVSAPLSKYLHCQTRIAGQLA